MHDDGKVRIYTFLWDCRHILPNEPGNVSCDSIVCRYFDEANPEVLTPTSVPTSCSVFVAQFSKYKALLQRMVYHSLIDDRIYWTL
jgi:hypothetical protein